MPPLHQSCFTARVSLSHKLFLQGFWKAENMNRVILVEVKQAAKQTAKRTVGQGQRLGTTIGEARTPIIDGDNDGKCREKNGTWIPCPPGVRGGSLLDDAGKAVGDDASPTVGIDPYKGLSQSYVTKLKGRLQDVGISRNSMKKELRKMFKKASPELVEVARTWYRRVKEGNIDLVAKVNEQYGSNYEEKTGAGIIAALSPAREFRKNVRDAKIVMKAIASDSSFKISDDAAKGYINHRQANISDEEYAEQVKRRTEQVAKLRKIASENNGVIKPSQFGMDELHALTVLHPELSTLGGKTGFATAITAVAIAKGADPDKVLSGPKVRSFYSNILNPEGDRATIDTWMYRAMVDPNQKIRTVLGKGKTKALFEGTWAEFESGTARNVETGVVGHAPKKLQDIFQGSPSDAASKVPSNTGLYPEFAEAVREVAEELGLAPAALQAVVWEVARTAKGKNKPSQWDLLMKEFDL
jgi:hypothetical protein